MLRSKLGGVGVDICVLSFVLVAGFALGEWTAARRQRKNGESQRLKQKLGAPVDLKNTCTQLISDPTERSRDDPRPGCSPRSQTEAKTHVPMRSRKVRKRHGKLTPKDHALDYFTSTAVSYVPCIGSEGYKYLRLLPRDAFVSARRFVPYVTCCDELVTLEQARTTKGDLEHSRILYVSFSWASHKKIPEEWMASDFQTVLAFLERNPDVEYIYVGQSCVASNPRNEDRLAQLHHVPLALLRADVVLVLPGPADVSRVPLHEKGYSDLKRHMRGAWSRMELAVAVVGRAKVYVGFRAPRMETLHELRIGTNNAAREMAKQAAEQLKETAASMLPGSLRMQTRGAAINTSSKEILTIETMSTIESACQNWLSTDTDPLLALESARTAVAVAAKSGDLGFLNGVRAMQLTPNELETDLGKSLGEEEAPGEKELALCLLLFTVFCSQPKERGTYADAFLDDAAKLDVVYRPIAMARSPYRERFGTPRQPQVTEAVLHGGAQEGQIVFLKGHGYGELCPRSDAVVVLYARRGEPGDSLEARRFRRRKLSAARGVVSLGRGLGTCEPSAV